MSLPEEKLFTEQDYYALPENVRAELIDGTLVYNMAAPGRVHQEILMELAATIRDYIRSHKGSCRVYPAPFAVKLQKDRKTIVEPDISVICDRSKLTKNGCDGAPDWIIEIISPGTSSRDYVQKLNLYQEAGVKEYWIIDPEQESVFVYLLKAERFKASAYTFSAVIPSDICPGFAVRITDLDVDL